MHTCRKPYTRTIPFIFLMMMSYQRWFLAVWVLLSLVLDVVVTVYVPRPWGDGSAGEVVVWILFCLSINGLLVFPLMAVVVAWEGVVLAMVYLGGGKGWWRRHSFAMSHFDRTPPQRRASAPVCLSSIALASFAAAIDIHPGYALLQEA